MESGSIGISTNGILVLDVQGVVTIECDKSSERNADGVHKIPDKQEEEDRYNILRELVADVHKGKFLPDFLPPMLQSRLEELKRQKELP